MTRQPLADVRSASARLALAPSSRLLLQAYSPFNHDVLPRVPHICRIVE